MRSSNETEGGPGVLGMAAAMELPSLTNAEADALHARYLAGDQGAFDTLIMHHLRMVGYMANAFRPGMHDLYRVDVEDIFGYGCRILIEQARRYESGRGVPFKSWMALQLRFRMYAIIRSERRKQLAMIPSDLVDAEPWPEPENASEELRQVLETAVSAGAMTQDDAELVAYRAMSINAIEVAERQGRDVEEVRAASNAALGKLVEFVGAAG